MKRLKFLQHLHFHQCVLLREGKKHSVFYNYKSGKTSTLPRHTEIDNFLAKKICKDLDIPKI